MAEKTRVCCSARQQRVLGSKSHLKTPAQDANPWAMSIAKLAASLDRFRLATSAGTVPIIKEQDIDDERLALLTAAYEDRLQRHGAIDYPVVLTLPLQLFQVEPRARRLMHDAYRFVMADEFPGHDPRPVQAAQAHSRSPQEPRRRGRSKAMLSSRHEYSDAEWKCSDRIAWTRRGGCCRGRLRCHNFGAHPVRDASSVRRGPCPGHAEEWRDPAAHTGPHVLLTTRRWAGRPGPPTRPVVWCGARHAPDQPGAAAQAVLE